MEYVLVSPAVSIVEEGGPVPDCVALAISQSLASCLTRIRKLFFEAKLEFKEVYDIRVAYLTDLTPHRCDLLHDLEGWSLVPTARLSPFEKFQGQMTLAIVDAEDVVFEVSDGYGDVLQSTPLAFAKIEQIASGANLEDVFDLAEEE